MKLIIAIVQDEDASRLINNLMTEGYRVTKLATTGGFLRAGNTTLLTGVADDQLDRCLGIVEKICKSRRQVTSGPTMMGAAGTDTFHHSVPFEVTVGGATVFVLSVDQFIKL